MFPMLHLTAQHCNLQELLDLNNSFLILVAQITENI